MMKNMKTKIQKLLQITPIYSPILPIGRIQFIFNINVEKITKKVN